MAESGHQGSTRDATDQGIETQSLEGPPTAIEHAHGFSPLVEGDTAVAGMEALVSDVLRYGVLASFAIALAGSLWLFLRGHTGYAGLGTIGRGALKTLTTYHAAPSAILRAPTTPGEVLTGLRYGKPYALIAFGLLVLIATPVLRVAISVATFLWEGDRIYAAITAYVLVVLIVSFLIGKGG